MKKSTWKVADSSAFEEQAGLLSRELGVTRLTALLLCERGFGDTARAREFIDCPPALFHSPLLMKDMNKAVARIEEALAKGEKIVIYGDYDVDGVTSVSILYLYLHKRGADVGYYIPNRVGEGYGASKDAVKQLADGGANLIITVDTGTTATDEVRFAAELGVDMIITDHHECHCELPDAVAVVNPMRSDCGYPFRSLAGVGVVFKLLCALEMSLGGCGEEEARERMMETYGDLVAIGTVADVMPVTDENRYIIKCGLEIAKRTKNRGLAALVDIALGSVDRNGTKKTKKLTSTAVGYIIAPRINAAGRIGNAARAVELFLTSSDEEAQKIANELCDMNRLRQAEENSIITEAMEMIGRSVTDEKIIVLDHDGWHNGVIGIVASRITERFRLPSILISFDHDIGKGSGRSIPGVNLVEMLGECSDLLIKFGGHELAAGMTIERSNLEEFKKRINAFVTKKITECETESKLAIDAETSVSDITVEQTRQICELEPFGIANPQPVFLLDNAAVSDVTALSGGKHTRLTVSKDGISCAALAFGSTPASLGVAQGDRVSIAYTMDINEFRGVVSAQILVRDICPDSGALEAYERAKASYHSLLTLQTIPRAWNAIPDRNDLAAVYVRLRQTATEGGELINYRAYSSAPSFGASMNYIKFRCALDILFETGIINLVPEGNSDECARVTLNFVRNKINIEKSTIYRRLRSRAERE